MAAMVETMFSANGIVPWHELGTVFAEEGLTSGRALVESGADWEVEKHPLFVGLTPEDTNPAPFIRPDDNGNVAYEQAPGGWAVCRGDRVGAEAVLGCVGNQYTPVQNETLFEFADALMETGAAVYDTAGVLFGGRRVWASAKFPEHVTQVAGEDDTTELYLLMSNAHDGSLAFRADVVDVRTVCNNTHRMALRGAKSSWSIRHTGGVENRVQEAKVALDLVLDYRAVYEEEMRDLYQRPMQAAQFDRLLEHLRPAQDDGEVSKVMQNDRDRIRLAYEDAVSCNLPGMEQTRYAALNAVTLWADHGWGGDDWRKKNAERVLSRIWWGSAHHLKQKAYELLRDEEVPQVEVKVAA